MGSTTLFAERLLVYEISDGLKHGIPRSMN